MGAFRLPSSYAIVLFFFGLVFTLSALIITILQLCSLLLWPLNRKIYRKISCCLAHSLWCQIVMLWQWYSGSQFTLFTNQNSLDKIGKEQAIIIFNHSFDIDFVCLWAFLDHYGILANTKNIMKSELLSVPLFGWVCYFDENLFCKRKWEEDKKSLLKDLNRLADYPKSLCFVLACEGTRFTKEKHQISMEVAKIRGMPQLKYHLLPRTRGFTTLVQALRGKVSAIYDITINFRGHQNPSFLGLIRREKYKTDMCFRRIPLEEIPLDENEAAKWLHKLYQDKDALQELYNEKGIFPGEQFTPSRRPWALLNALFWATVILSSFFKLAFVIFLSGSPLLILTFFGFLWGAFWGIQRLVGVSVTEKGSTYGKQEYQKKE